MSVSALRCPLCASAFVIEPQRWRCAQGHCFDVAREGYINLLPVQHKHSREPGDAAQSVLARRAFLAAGHYQPLREALVALLEPLHARTLIDIGCGEGYYTDALRAVAADVVGLDISKPAVRMAAKRFPGIRWIVGTGTHLPVADASVDLVCSLFTPLHEAEIARVLQPGGRVLIVTPGAEHLWEMREILFDTVQAHEPDKFRCLFSDRSESGFDALEAVELRMPLQLDQAALRNLVAMTPYAWKARPERRAALDARSGLETQAVFSIMQFVRR